MSKRKKRENQGGRTTRRVKLELVFNDEDRRNYLVGFKKRKQNRREEGSRKFDKRFKLEKNRIRNERRQARLADGLAVLPDNMLVSGLDLTATTHRLEQHTITVADISDLRLPLGPLSLTGDSEPNSNEQRLNAEQRGKLPGMELKQVAGPAREQRASQRDKLPGMELKQVAGPAREQRVSQRARKNIVQTKLKLQEKKNKLKSKRLQRHKVRVRKNCMKQSHVLKRQK